MTGPDEDRRAMTGPGDDRPDMAGPDGRPVALAVDHHVHSTFSDDAHSTTVENLAAARRQRLTQVCFVEHASATSTWTPVFTHAVRVASRLAGGELDILSGIEVAMLNSFGAVDLPAELPALDRILIADHHFPSETGPRAPEDIRRDLADGSLTPTHLVDTLVLATMAALRTVSRRTAARPQLAHLFGLLPKIGLTEEAVGDDRLHALAVAAGESGAVVECNERWRCPGRRVLDAFRTAGVEVVASTGSHRADEVGVYDWVAATLS